MTRAEAATQAVALLGPLAAAPDSGELRTRLVELFELVFVARQTADEPLLDAVPGQVLLRVDQFAHAGDPVFLSELMRAADGWYGATAEGGEWLNELLWYHLEARPQLTLTVLAELPTSTRGRLVEAVYTAPIHDGVDVDRIRAGLQGARIPPGLGPDVDRMIATVEQLK